MVFIIYGNAINNEYALDDNIVVDNNTLVAEGIKAIPEIFKSRYAVDSKQQYEYRPVVSVSFAIEKEFFGKLPAYQSLKEKGKKDVLTQANLSHFVNILIYAITCVLLYKCLRLVFHEYGLIVPLTVVALFIVHPMHTEAVSNIKSRDELFMFLFMICAIIFFIKYADTNSWKYLILAPLFVLLSFLSKRSGYTIAGVLPVLFYFRKVPYKKILIALGTLVLMWVCVVMLKKGLISQKAFREFKYFENPLYFEGGLFERLGMAFYCALFYLKMLIYPYHMSFYYGFSEIPLVSFKDWEVWLSILVYIPLTIYGVIAFLKRKIIGVGILIWLGLMLPFTNAIVPVVGIVADRFTYAFSLGFCIVISCLLFRFLKVDSNSKEARIKLPSAFLGAMAVILVVYSGRTIARNPDWHDYLTLYQNDIEHLENSAKAHALISNTMYPMVLNEVRSNSNRPGLREDVEKIVYHYTEALRVDSTYVTCYNNLGSAYINFYGDYENGLNNCLKALELKPDYEEAAANIASAYNGLNQPDNAIRYLLISIELNTENQGAFNMLTQLLKNQNRMTEGVKQLEQLEGKVDNEKYLFLNIGNLYASELGNIPTAIAFFEKARQIDPTDKRICQHIAGLYGQMGNQLKANEVLAECN